MRGLVHKVLNTVVCMFDEMLLCSRAVVVFSAMKCCSRNNPCCVVTDYTCTLKLTWYYMYAAFVYIVATESTREHNYNHCICIQEPEYALCCCMSHLSVLCTKDVYSREWNTWLVQGTY